MLGIPLIALIIIIITVLFSLQGFRNYNLFNRYKFQIGPIVQNKEYDRFLTAGFLHVNNMHLLFNMLTLYFFADFVISFFSRQMGSFVTGQVVFAVVYLLSILGGNFLALFFQKNNMNYSAVGASGGVVGILFAAIMARPDLELYLFFALPMKGWFFAFLFLGYSIFGMQKQIGNIGHEAHLGGAVVGMLAPLVINPDLIHQSIHVLGFSFPISVLFIPIVILFGMALKARK